MHMLPDHTDARFQLHQAFSKNSSTICDQQSRGRWRLCVGMSPAARIVWEGGVMVADEDHIGKCNQVLRHHDNRRCQGHNYLDHPRSVSLLLDGLVLTFG